MTHTAIRLDRFDDFLRRQNLSRTRPRRLLYRAMAAAGPQSPAGLVAALDGQVDRATVYRTIEFFLAHRIAVRINGEVELGDAFRPHHHHLVCDSCGRSESVDDEILERSLAEIAGRHGFTLDGHQVELTGVCAQCRASSQVTKSVIQ